MMGNRIHEVMATAHRSELTTGQEEEGQVHAAAPAVARLRGDVAFLDHLGSVDVRVVPELRSAALRLLRPAQEAIDGALRAIAIPEEQAEAQGCGLFSRLFQGRAQRLRADDAVRLVAVHRPTGEVVPGRVLGVPSDSGHELIHEDELAVHRLPPVNGNDTIRSMTSASGSP